MFNDGNNTVEEFSVKIRLAIYGGIIIYNTY